MHLHHRLTQTRAHIVFTVQSLAGSSYFSYFFSRFHYKSSCIQSIYSFIHSVRRIMCQKKREYEMWYAKRTVAHDHRCCSFVHGSGFSFSLYVAVGSSFLCYILLRMLLHTQFIRKIRFFFSFFLLCSFSWYCFT